MSFTVSGHSVSETSKKNISERRYKKALRLKWKNPHSSRLQRLLGDDRLMVAWDKDAGRDGLGRWSVARLCKRFVVREHFRKELATEVYVPVHSFYWQDACLPGRPGLPINDPRLVQHLREVDMWRSKTRTDDIMVLNDKLDDMAVKADQSEKFAQMWDAGALKAFQAMRDQRQGFIGREGDGGERKFFYDGCLY